MNLRLAALFLTGLAGFTAGADAATVTTVHSNTQTITINDSAPATPYPSTVAVSGLRGEILDVTVTLNGLSHTYPGDLLVRVVAPDGREVTLLNEQGGSSDVNNATVSFNQAGQPVSQPIVSATYYAPLSSLRGSATAANGNWSLFVDDMAGADIGRIATGWTLTLVRESFTTCTAEGLAGTKLTLCRQICETPQSSSTLTALIKMYTTLYRETPPCGL